MYKLMLENGNSFNKCYEVYKQGEEAFVALVQDQEPSKGKALLALLMTERKARTDTTADRTAVDQANVRAAEAEAEVAEHRTRVAAAKTRGGAARCDAGAHARGGAVSRGGVGASVAEGGGRGGCEGS